MLDDEGEVIARAPGFEEALLVVDVDPTEAIGRRLRDVRRRELERSRSEPRRHDDPAAAPHGRSAATLRRHRHVRSPPSSSSCGSRSASGLRDYVEKNGFADVVIAISGGIDSALTAAIAADASARSTSTPSRCRRASRPRGRATTRAR